MTTDYLSESWRAAYDTHLNDAIRALTAATRLERPVLTRKDDNTRSSDPSASEPTDWAEFVVKALAGAAANLGGVEAILAGRSGSWEAADVRRLLHSTVGPDEHDLWRHRTEPLSITLYVDEILSDHTDAWRLHDAENGRIISALAARPEVDYGRFAWEYELSGGAWVAVDPAAPAFSLTAYRTGLNLLGVTSEEPDLTVGLHDVGVGWSGRALVPKSADLAAELLKLEAARDEVTAAVGELEDALEVRRLLEWTAYGAALRTHVLDAIAGLDGLDVPVTVRADITTYRDPAHRQVTRACSLEERLVDAAIAAVTSPGDPEYRVETRLECVARTHTLSAEAAVILAGIIAEQAAEQAGGAS